MKTEVVTDYLGRKVRLTPERRKHILEHPEMQEWVEKIPDVLAEPDRVVRSRFDPESELKPDDAFVLTAYLTDTLKKGEVLWPRSVS